MICAAILLLAFSSVIMAVVQMRLNGALVETIGNLDRRIEALETGKEPER